jgi:hypothetical protein
MVKKSAISEFILGSTNFCQSFTVLKGYFSLHAVKFSREIKDEKRLAVVNVQFSSIGFKRKGCLFIVNLSLFLFIIAKNKKNCCIFFFLRHQKEYIYIESKTPTNRRRFCHSTKAQKLSRQLWKVQYMNHVKSKLSNTRVIYVGQVAYPAVLPK